MHTTRYLKKIVTGALTVALCSSALVVAVAQQAAAKPAASVDSAPALFRPSNGYWYVRGLGAYHYGRSGDVPVPADYNGDGRVDIAVFRPSNAYWFIRGVGWYHYGRSGDVPVPADYNGAGRVDIAVFRPSNAYWFIRGVGWYHYGSRGAVPVPADYNGDGRVDIAVFQPSNGYWFLRGVGKYQYGRRGDIPVPGRYNNDAKADVALFRPSNGYWYVRRIAKYQYGAGTDKPIAHILPAWYITRTFHGSSDDVVNIGADPDARIVRATYSGSDNFSILAVDSSGEETDLPVNTIGDYRGTTLLLPSDGAATRLRVQGSGNWTVTVADAMKYATHWSAKSEATGTNDEVLTIPGGLAAAERVRLRYTGADNFIVVADGQVETLDWLANEIGSWSGRELMPRGTVYLDITASGSWSITPG